MQNMVDNPLVMAYMGDTIYEQYIREYLIKCGLSKIGELQQRSLDYVSAKSQRMHLERLMNDNLVKASPVNTISGKFKFETTEDYLKNGFRQVVYVLGAPANQACFKLDIYCNFECLPSSPFLNYLPLSMNTEFASPEIKKKAGVIVQQKPIMKANEEIVTSEPPSIWQRLKNKFMDSLPGISKLITTGLVSAVPQLQLGTALANTMSTIASGINSVINPTPTQAPSMSTVAQTTNPNNNLSLSQIPLSNSTIVVPVPSNSANI